MSSQTSFWPNGMRGALSLSFDDARHSQLDNGLPVFARHNVRATFYLSPPAAQSRAAEWRAASAAGHELGNHMMTHPCSGNYAWSQHNALEDMSPATYEAELIAANTFVTALCGRTPNTFAYCCGQTFVGRGEHAQSTVPLVAKHFLAGRGFRDESWNDPQYCDLSQAYGMDADTLLFETLRDWLERSADAGGWLILAAHDIADNDRQCMKPAVLDELCDYCSDPAHGIWIDTVASIAQHIQNQRE